MAGLDKSTPIPTGITLHRKSRLLELVFDNGSSFSLPFEYLRVYSPSAEVRGHGPGQEVLQLGKRDVFITTLDPVGNYAIRPVFSDGQIWQDGKRSKYRTAGWFSEKGPASPQHHPRGGAVRGLHRPDRITHGLPWTFQAKPHRAEKDL